MLLRAREPVKVLVNGVAPCGVWACTSARLLEGAENAGQVLRPGPRRIPGGTPGTGPRRWTVFRGVFMYPTSLVY